MNADDFEAYRPLLFSIAYRMLGRASDAEDVVQDSWIRYAGVEPRDLRSPKAWLTTVVTRLSLDRLKSARHAREEYVGEWLPEPVLTSDEARPDAMLQRHESVTLAFLLLLETLTAEERAVFLLKEVFDYSHDEIAEMLQTTSANARQLLHRAKARVAGRRPRFSGDPAAKRAVAERFVAAMGSGDPEAVASLLAQDVGFWSDGGGKATAVGRPMFGRDAVARLLGGFARAARAQGILPRITIEIADVNAEPAIVLRDAGRLYAVYSLTILDGAVSAIRVVLNPDKLAFIDRQFAAR